MNNTKWIPCDERLPEMPFRWSDDASCFDFYESDLMYVTTNYGMVGKATCCYSVVTDVQTYEKIVGDVDNAKEPEWLLAEDENGVRVGGDVIAWMPIPPLPKPYKKEVANHDTK